jgi:thiamine kinase-like enzyme
MLHPSLERSGVFKDYERIAAKSSFMTIEQAITRIPSWQQASRLGITPLPGGVTNLNYRVDVDGDSFVVRIAAEGTERLGIDRRREYLCAVTASRTGVAPEVVHFLPDEGIMVTRFVAGQHLSGTDMARPEVTERVVQSMRRYHAGPTFEGSYSPFRTIEAYLQQARRGGSPLPQDIDDTHGRITEIEASLQRGQTTIGPCHNDLWGANLIDDGVQVCIVDWEYAGMGDIFFDLANYAIYRGASDPLDQALLRAYFGVVSDAAFARLKLLQIAAELREALWYLVALTVSSRWPDYSDHAANHFTRYRRAGADPRLPAWLRTVSRGA